jgi:hypothetical protein
MRGRQPSAVTAILALLLIASSEGCGGDSGDESAAPAAQAIPAQPPQFVDVTAGSGIAYEIGYRNPAPHPLVEAFATGAVAAGDYDLDGDFDVFITRGDIGPNLLYRNDGRGIFVDVAAAAGVAFTANPTENYRHSGPTFADMDGDRDLDLFIGGLFADPSFIFANNGDGTFSDVTAGSGIDGLDARHSISAAFGDYDLDGDLDMFVAHWGSDSNSHNPGDTEHLWRNDTAPGGSIRFTSVSAQAGISATILELGVLPSRPPMPEPGDYTFTPTFARVDGDLYPDILSVADYGTTRVFMNNGDGTFRDATDRAVITDESGMGSALADYDNDGDLDWFVSAIEVTGDADSGNRLYYNVGGAFTDATDEAGVRAGGWGWGACFADLDNDADLDLYMTNGWPNNQSRQDSSVVYVSRGDGTFAEEAARLGLADNEQGRGIVCADFDNDGDIDILQLHRGTPNAATYWRNDRASGNHLEVKLVGRSPNTHAAGARIFVSIGGKTQMREISIGNNFASQNPTVKHFGLGNETQVDELRVEWPDGGETILYDVPAGQKIRIQQ